MKTRVYKRINFTKPALRSSVTVTSVNLEHIAQLMKRRPQSRAVEVKREASAFPTRRQPPVVWAGCTSRNHYTSSTSSYGGYGTYVNNESLRRLIQPLHCDGTATEFEQDKCAGLKPKSNCNKAPIDGKKEFFQLGDSINRMICKYVRNVEIFCLRSDWFIFKARGAPWECG